MIRKYKLTNNIHHYSKVLTKILYKFILKILKYRMLIVYNIPTINTSYGDTLLIKLCCVGKFQANPAS